MKTVGVRELGDSVSAVVDEVTDSKLPIIVTKRGRPVAVLSAIDETAWEDFIVTNAPTYAAGRRAAEAAYARGERGRPLSDVIAQLEAEEK